MDFKGSPTFYSMERILSFNFSLEKKSKILFTYLMTGSTMQLILAIDVSQDLFVKTF